MGTISFAPRLWAKNMPGKKTGDRTACSLYRAVNGRAQENMAKVIELLGGIESLIGADDVVLLKPNVQWFNQGVPNLAAVAAFVELVMNRPGGFDGEVVIAENCHRGNKPWQSAGWTRAYVRNCGLQRVRNFNDLCRHLKEKYADRFTTRHLIDVDAGGRRVFSPADGPGYVYCDGTGGVPLIAFDNGLSGEDRREVIMTYPIIQTDRGTIIDFKNGIWKNGAYSGRVLRFINFAALNHHSTYCGATSAIKNYLGVSDLSGGPDPHNGGKLTAKYYNFHSFPFDKWGPGPRPGMIGAQIGVFLNTVRRADLNITTAQWIGLSSRTDPPVAQTKAVIACTDPVALDYHCTRYLLHPNSQIRFHDPDRPGGALHQYLQACAEHGGGVFDERRVAVKSFDFKSGRLQTDDELVVVGEKQWGRDPKALAKYLVLRYGAFLL